MQKTPRCKASGFLSRALILGKLTARWVIWGDGGTANDQSKHRTATDVLSGTGVPNGYLTSEG